MIEDGFGYVVFLGMITQNETDTVRFEEFQGLGEGGFEDLKFPVYSDSYGLERKC